MTTTEETWLSVPEVAEILGLAQRDVRSMLSEERLIAVRRGPSNALSISSLLLVEKEGETVVLPSLRGTLTTLKDAGYDAEESWTWLTAVEPELGESPIDALRAGKIHAVRRVAAMLMF